MTTPITEELSRFMQSGISISVASRDVRYVPSLARAAGCRVRDDRREIILLLLPPQARQLLADLASTGVVAVVFSLPSTNRTLQVKGRVLGIDPASVADAEAAARHREAFARCIIPLGYAHDLAYAVHCRDTQGMVAVRVQPTDVFEQTPGPKAGVRLAQ